MPNSRVLRISPHTLLASSALVLALAGCSSGQTNHAPTADSVTIAGKEDTDVVGRVAARDRDGDPLTFTVVRLPDHGSVTIDSSGLFTYTPVPDFHGRDSFEFIVSDGRESTAPATVAIEIAAVNDAPVITAPNSLTLDEDSAATVPFTITDIDGELATVIMLRQPTNGTVTLAAPNTLEYRPNANFNGQDTFEVSASDGQATAPPILITAIVTPVNDPPTLPAFVDIANSPETRTSRIRIPLRDVDGDTLTVTATSDVPTVATSSIDHQNEELVITPLDYGQSKITVTADDGQYSVEKSFTFSVEDVTKVRRFSDALSEERVIQIRNTSSLAVDFALSHNDKRLLTSIFAMLEEIELQPDEFESEPFERKLWRYVRDNVYHELPLSTQAFLHEPLLLINSIGWGLCDDVATVYMHLASAAGLTSRVWYLEGHVVPEVQSNGNWSVYDPDLAVYYTNNDGNVVGVGDLEADSSLITNPRAPLFTDYQGYTGYSALIGQIYSTTDDNSLADVVVPYLMVPQSPQSALVSIPPGATLSYPGKWTATPTGTDTVNRVNVAAYANVKLDLPAGFTGTIRLPLQLVHVSGSGEIRLDGSQFEIGSSQLADYLARPVRATRTLEIMQSASPIQIYMLLNPLRFGRGSNDEIRVTGKDVWALHVVESPTVANILRADSVESLRKPTP